MMENASLKPKSFKNVNEMYEANTQCQIKPKPPNRRKSKNLLLNDSPQNRGLYSSISESSMCYPISSIPAAIPLEHHASVSFLPIYQPPACCSPYQCCHHKQPQQPPMSTNINLNKKSINAKLLHGLNANESFTSLPPTIPNSSEDSPTRRRFSDPGLGNDEHSISSDETREADYNLESGDVTSLDFEEEMIALKKDYCKLSRDLSKTKKELALVKSLLQNQSVHSPLLISDLVKEIQSAADMREEAFISRVQTLVDQSSIAQPKKECLCESVLQRLESVESQLKQFCVSSDQKSTADMLEKLNISRGMKSTGYNGSTNTGYTSSNGHNPFTFSRESSASPSTEL